MTRTLSGTLEKVEVFTDDLDGFSRTREMHTVFRVAMNHTQYTQLDHTFQNNNVWAAGFVSRSSHVYNVTKGYVRSQHQTWTFLVWSNQWTGNVPQTIQLFQRSHFSVELRW